MGFVLSGSMPQPAKRKPWLGMRGFIVADVCCPPAEGLHIVCGYHGRPRHSFFSLIIAFNNRNKQWQFIYMLSFIDAFLYQLFQWECYCTVSEMLFLSSTVKQRDNVISVFDFVYTDSPLPLSFFVWPRPFSYWCWKCIWNTQGLSFVLHTECLCLSARLRFIRLCFGAYIYSRVLPYLSCRWLYASLPLLYS